ncbi:MAG: hypothetical protein RLZZ408_785 [Verrucomicrobiota bacterium]
MDPLNSTSSNLSLVAIIIGGWLAGAHLFGLLVPGPCIAWARSIPRSRVWGTLLLTVAALWSLIIASTTDLGEFSPMRSYVMIGIVAGAILLWKFVPDFLASRSLGFLLLLVANPVLETTFLQHGPVKIALAALAYAWVLVGLFLVGMPYLHRDLLFWISERRWLWKIHCWAGILYGLFLLLGGLKMEMMG